MTWWSTAAVEAEAQQVREEIAERLGACGGLRLHPDKTRVVYCQDGKRCGSYEHTSFTFLGYGFRVRKVRTKTGKYFFGFNPAISDDAAKRIRAQIRSWRLHLRSGASTGSTTTWSGGSCRNTSGTAADGCERETPWAEPQRSTPGSLPTGSTSRRDCSDRMMGAG